mgnify:CR=1 FL=1
MRRGICSSRLYGGTKGENISFKAFENATGKELAVKETVRFGDATIGSWASLLPCM